MRFYFEKKIITQTVVLSIRGFGQMNLTPNKTNKIITKGIMSLENHFRLFVPARILEFAKPKAQFDSSLNLIYLKVKI